MDRDTTQNKLFEGSVVDTEALNSFDSGDAAVFELPVWGIIITVIVVFAFGLAVYYTQQNSKKDESDSKDSDSE